MVDERAGGWRLAGAVLGSIALALVAGGLAAWISYNAAGTDDGGEFEDLGRALVALAAVVVVGIPVLVISVIVGVRRTVPPGRRVPTTATVLLATVVVPFLLGWATEAARRAGFDVLALPVAVLVVGAAGAAIGGAAGVVSARRVVTLLVSAGAVVALLSIAVEVRGDEVADRQRVARYERNGAPLALIDGTDLDAGFVGWDLQVVGGGHGQGEVRIQYDVLDRSALGGRYPWLVFEADPEPIDCVAASCHEVGRRADGRSILGRRVSDAGGGQARYTDVWVDVDGGRWRIEDVGTVDPRAAAAVLEALEAVDADAFVAGAEAGFNP